MSSVQPEPTEPRIIKKKKGAGGGAHGGAWKVAYADFVTAMMALFIVLWIMSQSQSIRQNVAQYFKNPGILPGATGLMDTSDLGGEMPAPGHSQDLQRPAPIKPDVSSDTGTLEQTKKRITEIIAQLPELSLLKDQIAIEINKDGLRIELLDKENSHFFEVGSANLKPETKALLKLIAEELGKLPNHIAVEGHTDSRPYGTKNYTNWELSADRANAARRILEENGIKPGQITSIKGCADRNLRNPTDPLDYQNRRVSILVRFRDNAGHLPLDLSKVHGRALKNPQDSGAATIPGSVAPQAPQAAAPLPPEIPPVKAPPAPTGGVAAELHQSRNAASEPAVAGEPQAAARPPAHPLAPVPGARSTLPPSVHLDDKVQEEVRQMLLDEGVPDSPPMSDAEPHKEPRVRLGW
jgi:chemotaxis protein MotB|uniref:OmpA-like domain-containing protein n=1 Tax=Desulfobacca acetoxidans TaxID=60893 RepID=A0A7V6A283_9BACT